MLCCVGLIGGMALGQSLGGPWTYIAPAAGFGVGFLLDMKVMKGMHGKGHHRPAPGAGVPQEQEQGPVPVAQGEELKAPYQPQELGKV